RGAAREVPVVSSWPGGLAGRSAPPLDVLDVLDDSAHRVGAARRFLGDQGSSPVGPRVAEPCCKKSSKSSKSTKSFKSAKAAWPGGLAGWSAPGVGPCCKKSSKSSKSSKSTKAAYRHPETFWTIWTIWTIFYTRYEGRRCGRQVRP